LRGIRSRQLYLLAAVAFLSGCSIIGLTVHFVPLAVELGFSRGEAAVMAAMAAGLFCIFLLLNLGQLPALDEAGEASRRNGQRV